MRKRISALSVVAAAALLLAACGGDDSKAETKSRDGASATVAAAASTPSTSSAAGVAAVSSAANTSAAATSSSSTARNALVLECAEDVKSFRFDGKLSMQGGAGGGADDPSSLVSSLLENVTFSGAYVGPDRTQMKLELAGADSPLAGQALEFVQIGPTSYMRLGNTPWQRQDSGGSSPVEDLNPQALCEQLNGALPAAAQSRKEKVNGIDAVRYDYDRSSLARLPGLLDALDSSELPENVNLSLWVAEKERFPVKMSLAASGQHTGERYSVGLEFNVSDLNSSNVTIEAPR
jgi:hypothetical protein